MSKFFDDTMQGLLEAIEIKNGEVARRIAEIESGKAVLVEHGLIDVDEEEESPENADYLAMLDKSMAEAEAGGFNIKSIAVKEHMTFADFVKACDEENLEVLEVKRIINSLAEPRVNTKMERYETANLLTGI